MRVNRGKQFEAEIRKALEKVEDISIDRIQDPMGGFMGVRTFADFTIYHKPNLIYLELKAIHGNRLNLNHNVSKNQWIGLGLKSQIKGVIAGLVVWYIEHDKTYYIPFKTLLNARNEGLKSISVKDIIEGKHEALELRGKKRRVFYTYDGECFIKELKKRYG